MSQVILYSSDEAGAPVITTAAGGVIGVLDACLVNGFNAKPVLSLSVSSGIATAQISAHGYKTGRFVSFSGADIAVLNGAKQITVVDSNVVSFPVAGVADGAASGAITCKRTPLGWTKPFAGTNLAAYAPSDPAAAIGILRVDDASVNYVRVVGYETMQDIDTGTGPFPTPTQMAGGLYWFKADNNNPTQARNWFLVGDGKSVYLAIASCGNNLNGSYINAFTVWGFGTLNAYRAGDTYSTFVLGNPSTPLGAAISYCAGSSDKSVAAIWHPRRFTGYGSAQASYKIGLGNLNYGGQVYSGTTGYGFGSYPNPQDYGLLLARVASVPDRQSYRGELPGILHALQELSGTFAAGDTVPGTGDLSGRTLFAIPLGVGYNSNVPQYLNSMFVDITGPW